MRTARRASNLNPGELFSPYAFGGNVYVFEGYDKRNGKLNYRLEKKVDEISAYIFLESVVYAIHNPGRIKGASRPGRTDAFGRRVKN